MFTPATPVLFTPFFVFVSSVTFPRPKNQKNQNSNSIDHWGGKGKAKTEGEEEDNLQSQTFLN